ncbi:hypothetical protein EP7_004053 [Isosphaeraceae bacterium EP7]
MLPALETSTGKKGPEILDNFMKEGPEKAMQRAVASTSPDEMAKQFQAVGYDTSKAQDGGDLTKMFDDFFGKMDGPSQLAVSLGIPLAVVGLISSFMGGGLMSMLGGGAAVAGGTGLLTQLMGGSEGAPAASAAAPGPAAAAPQTAAQPPTQDATDAAYVKGLPVADQTNLINFSQEQDPVKLEALRAQVAPHLDKINHGWLPTSWGGSGDIQQRMLPRVRALKAEQGPLLEALNKVK